MEGMVALWHLRVYVMYGYMVKFCEPCEDTTKSESMRLP